MNGPVGLDVLPAPAAVAASQCAGELDRLWGRGRAILGCELAIMGGAMTWVSERNLVAAISNSGGFGVIASGSMSPALLAAEIAATKALTSQNFGVNLITMHPELAIMGGAMTWVSERNLVAAISNAGGFGVIASGSMSPALLAAEIAATKALTSQNFGVNLITMHPELLELIDVCIEHRVGHVVLAGGLPSAAAIGRIKRGGARVFCFAPALGFARKLVRLGADAIIIEGSEAGGHIGPVSTAVLAQEILPHLKEVPVFVAGGIGRGEAMLSYLEMGAAGVQLGTRFVCAYESIAHPRFKQAFIRAAARDAVASVQLDPRFPVIPVRALVNPAVERFVAVQRDVIDRFAKGELSQKAAQLEIEHFWAGALRRAVIDGDIENGSLMAGQSVGLVTREQGTAAILSELVGQALAVLAVRGTPSCTAASLSGSRDGRE